MAAGNQAENGIWALLVQAATKIKKNVTKIGNFLCECRIKFQPIIKETEAILVKMRTSPTRLDRAVSIPAL